MHKKRKVIDSIIIFLDMAARGTMYCVMLLIVVNLYSCVSYELITSQTNEKASRDGKMDGSPRYINKMIMPVKVIELEATSGL